MLLLTAVLLWRLTNAGAMPPGEETAWLGLGVATPLRVFVPKDYDPEKPCPLIYHYHGTGGRASTQLMQRATGGRDYVIVAAPYAVPGEGSLGREGVEAEVARISQVRALLGEELSLDDRTFVGGFSKGGWMSDLLASRGFPSLAGAMIMGAGKIPDDVGRLLESEPLPNNRDRPLSIYVGIGQMDANHPYSRRAVAAYRGNGHRVVFEEFFAKGHQPESEAVYLRQWLRAHVASSERLTRGAILWWTSALAHAETLTPPIERFLYLEHVRAAPYAAHVTATARAALQKTLQRAGGHRALRREMEARRAYESALKEEVSFRRSSELAGIANAFALTHERFPDTFFGQRAGLDLVRLHRNFHTLRRSAPTQSASTSFRRPDIDERRLTQRFANFSQQLFAAPLSRASVAPSP